MTWIPTSGFLKGIITKAFIPIDINPETSTHFRYLYPGDQVHIFETYNDKWARGYVLPHSIPNDMVDLSINLNNNNETPVVFPLKNVKVIEHIDIIGNGDRPNEKPNRPKFPNLDHAQLDIKTQIKCAMNELNGLIFISYACGELKVFSKLIDVFDELYRYFITDVKDLVPELETSTLNQNITIALNKASKILASRELRVAKNDGVWLTVASKYQYILSRDRTTGDLLNLSNSIPPVISTSQEELALTDEILPNTLDKSKLTACASSFEDCKSNHILINLKEIFNDSSTSSLNFHNLFIHIYLRNEHRRLTENFVVKIKSIDDLQKCQNISSALFRNLPDEYLTGNIYMVVILSEEISLLKRKTFSNLKYIKKGIAAGIADISQLFTKPQTYDVTIHLFGAPFNGSKTHKHPFNWGQLIDHLMVGDVKGVAVNPLVSKIDASIKLLKHEPFGLSNRIKFSKHHSKKSISMIKPVFYDPFTDNNERLYISFGRIMLKKNGNNNGKKDAPRDLYTVEISAPNNESIKFSQGSNQREKKIWQLIAVSGGESIGEWVKIDNIALRNKKNKKLPIDDYLQLTVYINGVLAGQGNLQYKTGSRLVEYKKKPRSVEIISTSRGHHIGDIEVASVYVGKLYNSEVTIDNILEYESLYRSGTAGIDGLSNSLVALHKLKKKHLVKHFPELLTSLFGIVIISGSASNESEKLQELQDNTFKAIVFVLQNVFGYPHQNGHFLKCFEDVFVNQPRIAVFLWTKLSEVYSRGETIWDSYSKSVSNIQDILIRFATKSIQGSWEFEEYNEAVLHAYKTMAHFLSIKSSLLIEDQIKLLEVVDYMMTHCMYFDKRIILNWYETFIDAIRLRTFGVHEKLVEDQEHKIQIAKMMLILRFLGSDLARDRETRVVVLLKSIEWATEAFDNLIDLGSCRLACSVLNMCCINVFELLIEGELDIVEVCLFLFKNLPVVAKSFLKYSHVYNPTFKRTKFSQSFLTSYPFSELPVDNLHNGNSYSEILIELAIVIGFIGKINKEVAIEHNPNTVHLAEYFSRDDMYTVAVAVNDIIKCEYFPSSKWLSLEATIAENSLCVLELLSPVIFQKYITETTLDVYLCGEFISALLKLGVLDTVASERLPGLAKSACTSITSTVGGRVENLVEKVWNFLGYDVNKAEIEASLSTLVLDYDLIHNVVLYTLKCTKSRKTGSKLLVSIMMNYNQIEVERQCIISLFDIYCNGLYEPSEVDEQGFINNCKESSINQPENDKSVLFEFIAYLSRFMKVLNLLIRIPDTAEFSDDKVVSKIRALLYLVNVGEPEPLREFISDLYKSCINTDDYIQAGLYLEIMASTFPWNDGEYVASSQHPDFPAQTSFARREGLLELAAQLYIKGQNLEKAIEVYNYMLNAYRTEASYDLVKLSEFHRKLSLMYLQLSHQDDIPQTFAVVKFTGDGFPKMLQNKDRIYQGSKFQDYTSLKKSIYLKYPGKHLEINQVFKHNSNNEYALIQKIAGSNVMDLWTEEVIFTGRDKFPSLFGFIDVQSYKKKKKNPIDNAITTIVTKRKELQKILYSTKNRTDLFQDLSRVLTGVVDAPVNGGINVYRAFFTDPKYQDHSSARKIGQLHKSINDLVDVIKKCLDLHERIVPGPMKELHEALVELFEKNFTDS